MMSIMHPISERGDDLYETPPEAVTALMRAEELPHFIWEPACGPGAIARTLRAAGHDVLATDLIDYESPDQDHGNFDFLRPLGVLAMSLPAFDVQAIVTNPPFKHAGAFVEKALGICPRVYMLLRLSFLESVRRTSILESGALARVHVFRNRLPMMHRAGWQGNKTTSTTAYAWFCWDTEHQGPTTLHRLSWHMA